MASGIDVLPFGRRGSIVIASIFSTASIDLLERIGAAGEAGSLAGLGLALFLAIAALLLYAMVGKILAIFLAATRCEVPLLDCTASGADTLDVRAILDDLLSNESQVDETRSPQTRIFEWMDTPAGDDLTE